MVKKIAHAQDVARWRLCLGCGACAAVCPEQNIRLVEYLETGIQPMVLDVSQCESCRDCLEVCPGYANDHTALLSRPGIVAELAPSFGPVLELWEGHAIDVEIRFSGASGGILTALALHCLDYHRMHGVLHIGPDPENPLQNRTTMSRNRVSLLCRAGSRYAPASACDSLHLMEQAPSPCVFIGQPSEVTALRKAQALRPMLNDKVGLALSFCCAGTPAAMGTLQLLHSLGVDPAQVAHLRYRGLGWPGAFAVTLRGQDKPSAGIPYRDAWVFLEKFRPYATHLSPDGTGEDADIACGDPWYRKPQQGEDGSSLIVVRTERGRQILQTAAAAGAVHIQPLPAANLLRSQNGLIQKRGAIWGRLLVFRMLGLPAPHLRGFNLWRSWLDLSWENKARSTLGTLRRIIQRKYYRPLLQTHKPVPRLAIPPNETRQPHPLE